VLGIESYSLAPPVYHLCGCRLRFCSGETTRKTLHPGWSCSWRRSPTTPRSNQPRCGRKGGREARPDRALVSGCSPQLRRNRAVAFPWQSLSGSPIRTRRLLEPFQARSEEFRACGAGAP